MKENNQNKNNLSNKVEQETLTKEEHRLLLEGYGDKELADIYVDLKDLDIADLSDYFLLERRYGRN